MKIILYRDRFTGFWVTVKQGSTAVTRTAYGEHMPAHDVARLIARENPNCEIGIKSSESPLSTYLGALIWLKPEQGVAYE